MIDREFVPYEQALALKELGFHKPCFGVFDYCDILHFGKIYHYLDIKEPSYLAPTFSQAFRWLYQKLDIEKGVMPLDTESQQLLLKELIDKVSSKHLLV